MRVMEERINLLMETIGRYSASGHVGSVADVARLRVYDRLRCEELTLCTTARQEGSAVAESAADFAKLSSLDHPSLARVRDFGVTEDVVFYSREPGLPSTLKDLPAEGLDEGSVFQCLVGAAEGLAALHDSGLVHGLVTPEHVQASMVGGAFAGVRIADAGLRRLLSRASLKAREGYDPPEVRAGAEITPASDVYQLGTTLFELLRRLDQTAAPPRKQSRLPRRRERGVDRHLLELLEGLVAPDPRKRYANGRELRRAVQGVDWALPGRSHEDVKSLVTPHLVGRERELGQFAAVLKEPPPERLMQSSSWDGEEWVDRESCASAVREVKRRDGSPFGSARTQTQTRSLWRRSTRG